MNKTILLILLILFLFAVSVSAAVNLNACKTSGWVNGETYYLTQDITATGDCMVINAANVILDCQNYKMTGDGGSSDTGVFVDAWSDSSLRGVTVRNCEIENFGFGGVEIYRADATIENVYAHDCDYGLYLYEMNYWGGTTSVSDCNASDNLKRGIFLLGGGSGTTLTDNTADNTASASGYGVDILSGTSGNTFINQRACNNGYLDIKDAASNTWSYWSQADNVSGMTPDFSCSESPGASCTDNDGDNYYQESSGCDGEAGFLGHDDCDDTDSSVNAGATESCDAVDNNCNGQTDEGFDQDGDTYFQCTGDCNDNDATIKPGATEVCDGKDNDCDGLIDNDASCCSDQDWDGYSQQGGGNCCGKKGNNVCNAQADCDDSNKFADPGETEDCATPYDDNCDGQVNPGCDYDSDGSAYPTDCNDQNAVIRPGATEVCDGVDNNCDGIIDTGCTDTDNDGVTDSVDVCPADDTNTCNDDAVQEVVYTTESTTLTTGNGDLSLDIDAGDLASDTIITIEQEPLAANFALSQRRNVDAYGVYSYSIGPHGTVFNNPVTLILNWPDVDDNGRVDTTNKRERGLEVYWYNEDVGKWEKQAAVCDLVNNYCSLQITHLSNYSLATDGTRLDIYDSTETSPGCGQVVTYANYTNSTDDPIEGATCYVTYDTEATQYLMTWDGVDEYTDNSKSYAVTGTYSYNITCSHTDYDMLNVSDIISIDCDTEEVIPEFSTVGIIIAVIIAIGGMVLVVKRRDR